jgi:hypothetical protein
MPHITITFLGMQTTMSASSSSLPAPTISLSKEQELEFHKAGIEKLQFDEQTSKNERVKRGFRSPSRPTLSPVEFTSTTNWIPMGPQRHDLQGCLETSGD